MPFNCFHVEKTDGILSLIGGFFVHLTLGTLYCFGNMNTYMTSYLRQYVHPGIVYSDMIWIPVLATIGQGLFMTCSGYIEDYVGTRMTMLLGCAVMTTGVYLTYFAIQLSVFLTIMTYGFMFGFGLALAYAPPLAVAMKWFPRQKGLVNGVIVGGFGLGAFIFNQIQTTYLNPINEELDADGYFSDPKILQRVPSVFLLLGSIYGIIQVLSILLICPPPENDVTSMLPLVTHATDGDGDEEADDEADEDELLNSDVSARISLDPAPDQENIKPRMMVKSKEFWILWATFFFNTQAIGYINSMYKAYGQTFITDDHFLAIVGAVAAIFNATGRIFWGHLCDAFGYKTCMMVVTSFVAVLYSTFYFIPVGGKPVFAIWVWAIFFCFCANFVLLPTATAQCFGTKYASKNYGLVMTGQAAAAPLLAILTQLLSPTVGFLGMFLTIAVFSLICTVLNMRFPRYPSPRCIAERLERPPSQL